MGDETTNQNPLGPITVKMVALSFNLVDYELQNLPANIEKALADPSVIQAIQKSLVDFAKAKQNAGASQVTTNEEGVNLVLGTLGAAGKASGEAALERLKKSSDFKALESNFKNFVDAAKGSSAGVWIDKNKVVLIVVGSILMVGTSVAMFATRTGGPLAQGGALMLNNLPAIPIGDLKLKLAFPSFKPDARVLESSAALSGEFQRVKMDLKLALTSDFNSGITNISGDFTFSIKDALTLNVGGAAKPLESAYDLHFNGTLNTTLSGHALNMTVGITASDKALGGNAKIDLGLAKGLKLSAGTALSATAIPTANVGLNLTLRPGMTIAAGAAYGPNAIGSVGLGGALFKPFDPKTPDFAAGATFGLSF